MNNVSLYSPFNFLTLFRLILVTNFAFQDMLPPGAGVLNFAVGWKSVKQRSLLINHIYGLTIRLSRQSKSQLAIFKYSCKKNTGLWQYFSKC